MLYTSEQLIDIVNKDKSLFDRYFSEVSCEAMTPESKKLLKEAGYLTWVRSSELWKEESDYLPQEHIDFYFKINGVNKLAKEKLKKYCSIAKSVVRSSDGRIYTISGIVSVHVDDVGTIVSSKNARTSNILLSCSICCDTKIHSKIKESQIGKKVEFIEEIAARTIYSISGRDLSTNPLPMLSYKISEIKELASNIGLALTDCITLEELFVASVHNNFQVLTERKKNISGPKENCDIFDQIQVLVRREIRQHVKLLERKNKRLVDLLSDHGVIYDKIYPGDKLQFGSKVYDELIDDGESVKASDGQAKGTINKSDSSLFPIIGALLSMLAGERIRPYKQDVVISCIHEMFGDKGFSKSKLDKIFSEANKAAREKEKEKDK